MATGHAKNIVNLETAVITVNNLGAGYNPSQPLIQLAALQTKLTAKEAMRAVDLVETVKKIAGNPRAAEVGDITALTVNIERAAEVDVNDAVFAADSHHLPAKCAGNALEKLADNFKFCSL